MPARSRSLELRRQLVHELEERALIRSDAVREAFLAVPRERFVHDFATHEGVEAVYRDEAIPTKFDPRGFAISSSSQPAIMAEMLEQMRLAPGMRVLEIGAGTGYNAALLAEIVGRRGVVTTIDVDPQIAHAARVSLRRGNHRVRVVVGDGRGGFAARAPYDRIIVTASAETVPRPWFDQLEDGGMLEVPLRLTATGMQVIPHNAPDESPLGVGGDGRGRLHAASDQSPRQRGSRLSAVPLGMRVLRSGASAASAADLREGAFDALRPREATTTGHRARRRPQTAAWLARGCRVACALSDADVAGLEDRGVRTTVRHRRDRPRREEPCLPRTAPRRKRPAVDRLAHGPRRRQSGERVDSRRSAVARARSPGTDPPSHLGRLRWRRSPRSPPLATAIATFSDEASSRSRRRRGRSRSTSEAASRGGCAPVPGRLRAPGAARC